MKRTLTAMVVGIVIGYGVQCEDSTGPQLTLAQVPVGTTIIAFNSELAIDSDGRTWHIDQTGVWRLRGWPKIPIPADSVAHFDGASRVIVAPDNRSWQAVANGSDVTWVYLGKPPFP